MGSVRITVFCIIWAALGFNCVLAAAQPAPRLEVVGQSNTFAIELFLRVTFTCTPPRNVRYPITLMLGKNRLPLTAELTFNLMRFSGVDFFIAALLETEGSYVCWYIISTTGEVSETSNSVIFSIASVPVSLPPPVPSLNRDFIPLGGNYTVSCDISRTYPNATLTLYYRNLAQNASQDPQPLNPVDLPPFGRNIKATVNPVSEGDMFEFFCLLEVRYNHTNYKSPLSDGLKAIPEKAPVRLNSRFKGLQCAGWLEMFLNQQWTGLCQGEADSSVNEATARVVCRELGCGAVNRVRLRNSGFLVSSTVGPMKCTGSEARVRDCPSQRSGGGCPMGRQLEILCTGFLTSPIISALGHGDDTNIYLSERDPLTISCKSGWPWLGDETVSIFLNEPNTLSYMTSRIVSSEEPALFLFGAPVTPGVYSCQTRFDSMREGVNTNFSRIAVIRYFPPNVGLIVGALISTLVGVGIIVFLCVFRVSNDEN